MKSDLIEQLARLQGLVSRDLNEKARTMFQVKYARDACWHIAVAYARDRRTFPLTLIGRDRWLFIAYMTLLNPSVHCDRDVEDARQLRANPGTAAKLNALIMAGLGQPIDAHLQLVAEKTGFAKRAVEAYETLFFNVLDRAADRLYISHIVYPHSRVVELAEDYFDTTPAADLLLRAAYNHRDIDLVLRLAGMTDKACRQEAAALSTQERELTDAIMGNALLMSKMGLLNQRCTGLTRATSLLAASSARPGRVNPVEPQVPHDLAGELAAALAAVPPLTDDERRDLQAAARAGTSYWHDEEDNIVPFDFADLVPGVSKHSDTPSAPFVEFPEPVNGIWRNQDFDKPVVIVARMSEPGLPDHYLTDENTGIPASEVFFYN